MSERGSLLEPPSAVQTQSNLPTQGSAPEKRLAPLRAQDLGEQIVGSDHHFPIPGLVNLSDKPAFIWASVAGAGALTVPDLPELVAPMQQAPLAVEYAPLAAGENHAELTLHARWADGHEETDAAPIVARARALEDVPGTSAAAPLQAAGVPPPQAVDKRAPALEVVKTEMIKLRGAVSALISDQKTGVDTVRDEQGHFKAAPADPSIWMDLVEVAIAMATDGVGEIVEHLVMKAVEKVGKTIVKKAAHHAAAAIAHAAEHESESLTASTIAATVGGGVKHVIERRLSGGEEGAEPAGDHEQGGAETGGGPFSANPTVDFFARQQHVLNNASMDAKDRLADMEGGLAPLAHQDPDAALATIQAITSAVRAAFDHALREQAQATASQFAAFKARLALGAEEVGTGPKVQTVTKLEGARRYDGLAAPATTKGLLEIYAQVTPSEVRVTGARIDGVASAVATRLLVVDLAARGVPLRIVLGNSYGVITRDELGRVRYSGYLPLDADSKQGSDEIQQQRGAERIANLVLSRSLHDWGVAAVETNDVGKEDE